MKSTQRILICVALLGAALLLPATAAWAQSPEGAHSEVLDGTPRANLILRLSAIHESPDAEQLRAIPLETSLETALIELAVDDGLRITRGRAINALADEAGPETLRFVEEFIAKEADGDTFLLGRTLRLAGTLSASHPEWALERLEPLVGHSDPAVREYVVMALGDVRANQELVQRVDSSLTQLVIAERNPAVQEALRKVLKKRPTLEPVGVAPIRRVPSP